ncbi:MAG: glycoside hydrolase family 113 [Acidimicrobiales bacterium]
MRRRIIGLVALLIVTSGVVAWHLRSGQDPASDPGITTGAQPTHRLAENLGIDIWWHKRDVYDTPTDERSEAEAIVRYVDVDLHANSISIGFPIYTASDRSDLVFTRRPTPSTSDLLIVIRVARAAGLRIQLRPLINVGIGSYSWRGRLKPTDLKAFFTSYYEVLKPYLELAQREKMGSFVYASEFWSLSVRRADAPAWAHLVSLMRLVYHGHLEYDSSGVPYLDKQVIVPGYDHVMDAYFSVPLGAKATVAQLYKGWVSRFDELPASVVAHSVIEELGFIARSDGYEHPSRVDSGPTDSKYLYMQDRWFTMACEIVHHFHIRGVYFWNLDFNTDPLTTAGTAKSLGPTVWADRAGATAIARCFRGFAA